MSMNGNDVSARAFSFPSPTLHDDSVVAALISAANEEMEVEQTETPAYSVNSRVIPAEKDYCGAALCVQLLGAELRVV